MLRHRPSPRRTAGTPYWRLLALAVATVGLVGILVTGLALSLIDGIRWVTADDPAPPPAGHQAPTSTPAWTPPSLSPRTVAARDAIADRAMPDTGTGHPYGRPELSTRNPGAPIVLPPARDTGAWMVATGYPQTPEGALAQLAAIDVAALGSASLAGVRAVIRDWAARGGPTPNSWSAIAAMRSLLESTGVATDGTARVSVRAQPEMGLIKGTDGDDFVVACVDLTVDITFGGTSRTAAADCQRMVWDGRRWVIGPGREPAKAPSVWPGTDAALDAGYRDLVPAWIPGTGRD